MIAHAIAEVRGLAVQKIVEPVPHLRLGRWVAWDIEPLLSGISQVLTSFRASPSRTIHPRQSLGRGTAAEVDEVVGIGDDPGSVRLAPPASSPVLEEPVHLAVGEPTLSLSRSPVAPRPPNGLPRRWFHKYVKGLAERASKLAVPPRAVRNQKVEQPALLLRRLLSEEPLGVLREFERADLRPDSSGRPPGVA